MHAFLRDHRDEILERVRAQVVRNGPQDAQIDSELRALFETIVLTLSVESAGQPVDERLEPRRPAEGLARAGLQGGLSIAQVASALGAISRAVGDLGQRENVAFEAKRYRCFHDCMDKAMEAAMQRYAEERAAGEQHAHAERVGSMLHELRNAVGAARLALDLLERGRFRVESAAGQKLKRAVGRLHRLVSQGLLAARLEGGAGVSMQPVDVSCLLAELASDASTERGIVVASSAQQGLRVLGDEMLLASAIGNLLANAVKFTRDGGHVDLRAGRLQGDGAVLIEVEDECGGLPPGATDRIFEPFVQSGRDRSGAGLGLSITRDAVAALGGRLRVRDMPGKGCVFCIELMVAGSPGEASTPSPAP